MPYFLLIIGVVLAVGGFYRFFLRASSHQIKSVFLSVAAVVVGISALWLTLTGRLPIAIAVLTALWPLAISLMRSRNATTQQTATQTMPMNAKEAYEVLGLDEGASDDDIKSAHLRLMKKLHPDPKGSDWLAQKINAARDMLLKP